MQTQRTQTMSD